jgi:hypothetical protein
MRAMTVVPGEFGEVPLAGAADHPDRATVEVDRALERESSDIKVVVDLSA